MADAKRDGNFVTTLLGVSDADGVTPVPLYADPTTHRLKVDLPGGTGTVLSVSVVSANGFAGSVATATTTPAITLSTSINGILKGNGTAISAVTVGAGLSFDGTTLSSNTAIGGSATQVQYNNAGVFAGISGATSDGTTLTLVAPVLGTPASGTLTNCTGLPISTGVSGLAANVATFLATPSSANLAAAVTNETGTGALVFATSPTLVTPNLGTPASGTVTNLTGTASININGTVGATTPNTGAFTTVSASTTGNPATFTNTTDSASVQGLIVQGDRATPAVFDSIYQSFKLSDNAGNQDDFARISAAAFSVVSGAENGALGFEIIVNGAMTGKLLLFGNSFVPTSNDDVSLGSASQQFSDLFLAEGGVINWDNGDVTLTQSGNTLTLAGGDLVLAENTSVQLDPALSADGTYSGITITGTAGATLAFGDLIYLSSVDSRWELVDADSVTTCGAVLTGMCVLAAAGDGSATTILLQGNIRADTAFPTLTIGANVYASTTAGDVQTTAPSATDDVVHVLGKALTADSMYFNPSQDYITIV